MAILGTILVIIMVSVSKAKAIETPQYKVVHSEPEFEIRLYTKSTWMSASIPHLSFAKATRIGYHRLFQYIEGANLNATRIQMTIPVLTSIVPDNSLADFVRFYLPPKFQADPPTPLPELKLTLHSFNTRCIAARKFSGFARDWNIGKEAEKLVAGLSTSEWANSTSPRSSGIVYSVAQYSSPFKFTKRLNEVWIDIDDGSGLKDCIARGIASY